MILVEDRQSSLCPHYRGKKEVLGDQGEALSELVMSGFPSAASQAGKFFLLSICFCLLALSSELFPMHGAP